MMAYDADRSRVVLFGGDSLRSTLFNDTWEWDGENWTQMADTGPPPRSKHAMAYDAVRHRVVLFGGTTGGSTVHRDTWEWDGEDWTQVADSGPSARMGHALAFDSARSRIVLFGGKSLGTLVRDTWEWNGEDWTQAEDTGPSARMAHVMTYDTVRQRTVLFGGSEDVGIGLGDTWEWEGLTWTQRSDFGPDPCLSAAMVFKGDRVVLFGGLTIEDTSPRIFGNTWEWDGKHWTKRQDIGPGPRWGHAMAFDSTRRGIVIFGGLPIFPTGESGGADRLLGDTWEHTERESAQPPSAALPIKLESFVITPIGGRRATGTITLSGDHQEPVVVILHVQPEIVVFDPPVTDPGGRNIGPRALPIPPGIQSLHFSFTIQPGFEIFSLQMTATLADSSLVAQLVP